MGTFLKVVGVIALIWFGLSAVGCAIIMRAVSSGAGSAAFHDARDRSQVAAALRDDEIAFDRLPSDMESAPEVIVTLRDGSTHVLKNSSTDRSLRALIAERAEAAQRAANRGSPYGASYGSSYDAPSQPHFKPGEPMVNPNPSSRYDN